MTDRRAPLQDVDWKEAVSHALWEAHACIGQWAFCACLAMLRKAVDLWSAAYRDTHNIIFDLSAGEKDNVFWRLKKIAEQNRLYAASIHDIIDGLRLDANDAVHESVVCVGGREGKWEGDAIVAIRSPYERLHTLVAQLISTTTPGLTPLYSDKFRWRPNRPRLG